MAYRQTSSEVDTLAALASLVEILDRDHELLTSLRDFLSSITPISATAAALLRESTDGQYHQNAVRLSEWEDLASRVSSFIDELRSAAPNRNHAGEHSAEPDYEAEAALSELETIAAQTRDYVGTLSEITALAETQIKLADEGAAAVVTFTQTAQLESAVAEQVIAQADSLRRHVTRFTTETRRPWLDSLAAIQEALHEWARILAEELSERHALRPQYDNCAGALGSLASRWTALIRDQDSLRAATSLHARASDQAALAFATHSGYVLSILKLNDAPEQGMVSTRLFEIVSLWRRLNAAISVSLAEDTSSQAVHGLARISQEAAQGNEERIKGVTLAIDTLVAQYITYLRNVGTNVSSLTEPQTNRTASTIQHLASAVTAMQGSGASWRNTEKAPEPRTRIACTVYHPSVANLQKWESLLVYISTDDLQTLQRVAMDAADWMDRLTGVLGFSVTDVNSLIKPGAELTIAPRLPGFDVLPRRAISRWEGDLLRHSFKLRARHAQPEQQVVGAVRVFVGPFILADVPVSIRIASPSSSANVSAHEGLVSPTVSTYRNIFASYSHRDSRVVKLCAGFAKALGDRYLIDVIDLRAGEHWRSRVRQFIDQADVFQLFWSRHAAQSKNVEEEWRYALTLLSQRPNFIRPVHWNVHPHPIPSELKRIHFARLDIPELETTWPWWTLWRRRPA